TAGNTIAQNGGTGVAVTGLTSLRDAIQHNSIFGNSGIGIDLGSDGATPNDIGDVEAGPNNLQNFPSINSATYDLSVMVVQYSVDSTTGASAYPLTVEFFIADASGQGKTFIGSDTYSTPQAVTTATFAPNVIPTATDNIVATATDNNGNTSE